MFEFFAEILKIGHLKYVNNFFLINLFRLSQKTKRSIIVVKSLEFNKHENLHFHSMHAMKTTHYIQIIL